MRMDLSQEKFDGLKKLQQTSRLTLSHALILSLRSTRIDESNFGKVIYNSNNIVTHSSSTS